MKLHTMINMIVDTSVFVAFYHESDVHHEKAISLLKEIESNGSVLISDYLLNEFATVSLRKMGLEKAKQYVDFLLNNEKVYVRHTSKEEFYVILEIFKKQTGKLSFIDCSIVWLSEFSGQNVVSFDNPLMEYLKTK